MLSLCQKYRQRLSLFGWPKFPYETSWPHRPSDSVARITCCGPKFRTFGTIAVRFPNVNFVVLGLCVGNILRVRQPDQRYEPGGAGPGRARAAAKVTSSAEATNSTICMDLYTDCEKFARRSSPAQRRWG